MLKTKVFMENEKHSFQILSKDMQEAGTTEMKTRICNHDW